MAGKRILVVDDSRDIREMLSQGLRSAGYDVQTAGDGEEALLIAEALRPDLLILDVMMPIQSGWEVLRTLRKHPALSATKVLVLTAMANAGSEAASELYGADAHMDKPFAFTELLKRISQLL